MRLERDPRAMQQGPRDVLGVLDVVHMLLFREVERGISGPKFEMWVQTFVGRHIGCRNGQRRRSQEVPRARDDCNLVLDLGKREKAGVCGQWKRFAETWLFAEHLRPGAEVNQVMSHVRNKYCR